MDIKFGNMAIEGVHEKVLDLINPFTYGSKIVVMGSGEGSFENKLLSLGIEPKNIFSIDINAKKFKLKKLKIVKADLNLKLPLDDEFYDLCIAIEVIEHLHNPSNLISEAYRILHNNGYLVITTPNIHSYMQKIRFLFTDKFDYFEDKDFDKSGHIHPIFDW